MNPFFSFFRRRAVREYLDRLPHLLLKDYGDAEGLSPEQVLRAIERHGLSLRHALDAVAIFSTPEGYVRYRRLRRVKRDYRSVRSEIAAQFFDGDIDFIVRPRRADPPDSAREVSFDARTGQ